MAIKIIKNALEGPIIKTCNVCGSEFSFEYTDIETDTISCFIKPVTYRYIKCPVCKSECSIEFNTNKEETDGNSEREDS